MSLRPAQDLVAESSKFSLRNYFETNTVLQEPKSTHMSTQMSTQMSTHSQLQSQPQLQSQQSQPPPSPSPSPLQSLKSLHHTKTTTAASSKFTFNGLMQATTPSQIQHKLIAEHQHQQQQQQQPLATFGKPIQDQNELLRLKAQSLALTDRISHLTANLAATTDSVSRGNKQLTLERCQFHNKHASLTKEIDSLKVALSQAEEKPIEALAAVKNLNTVIKDLQTENERLTLTAFKLTNDALETSKVAKDESSDSYTTLAAKYSIALEELSSQAILLEAATAEITVANELAENVSAEFEETVGDLKSEIVSHKNDVATADNLVDKLDARLATQRVEATACCEGEKRCQEMQEAADKVAAQMEDVSIAEHAILHDNHLHLCALADRAKACHLSGEPEREIATHLHTGTEETIEEFNLKDHIKTNYLPMARTFDESFLAHAPSVTDASEHKGECPVDESTMTTRTSAYVTAISHDVKISLDTSGQFYQACCVTGGAVRV